RARGASLLLPGALDQWHLADRAGLGDQRLLPPAHRRLDSRACLRAGRRLTAGPHLTSTRTGRPQGTKPALSSGVRCSGALSVDPVLLRWRGMSNRMHAPTTAAAAAMTKHFRRIVSGIWRSCGSSADRPVGHDDATHANRTTARRSFQRRSCRTGLAFPSPNRCLWRRRPADELGQQQGPGLLAVGPPGRFLELLDQFVEAAHPKGDVGTPSHVAVTALIIHPSPDRSSRCSWGHGVGGWWKHSRTGGDGRYSLEREQRNETKGVC